MDCVSNLTNFFLFLLKSDPDELINNIEELTCANNSYAINQIIMMRENFTKFHNLVDEKCIKQLILLYIKSNKELETNNDNVTELFDLINKLVKYTNNVNLIDFVEEFFSYDKTQSKEYLREYKNKNSHFFDSKNTADNIIHNLILFWLNLTDSKKQRVLDMMKNYFTNKLSKIELDIIFKKNQVKYSKPTIDCFDSCKKNVIFIQKLEDYKILNTLIENKNNENNKKNNINAIKVDTIYFRGIKKLSQEIIEVPFDIKNIKIAQCEITNLDWLHENIEIIDCSNNNITQLDNLPRSVKILICSNNCLRYLNNLPEGLEYLDAHTNMIEGFDLPKTLKYFNCSNNKISSIDNLPNELFHLNCSRNTIKTWTKLPDYLEEFNCKSNKLTKIDELKFPFGIKQINLSKNYIEGIYSLNLNIIRLFLHNNCNLKLYH